MKKSDRNLAFDAFIAIDWSGAKTANGIAVAMAHPGSKEIDLVSPPGGAKRWTRLAVVDFLAERFSRERCVCGFDFALSLPTEPAAKWASSARDLWKLVDTVCRSAPEDTSDLYARAFAETPPYAESFWTKGPRPEGFLERSRDAEIKCAEWGLGAPQTPFKLIGAKQVGLGSLCGMRVLHRLSAEAKASFFAWPFDGELPALGESVVVEIYPRLFLRAAGGGGKKVRDGQTLQECLAFFGAKAATNDAARLWSDHETDAMISAAGLRKWAEKEAYWRVTSGQHAAQFEGWIFGAKDNE